MTTLWILPNLPKYSGRFRTCGHNAEKEICIPLIIKFWVPCEHKTNNYITLKALEGSFKTNEVSKVVRNVQNKSGSCCLQFVISVYSPPARRVAVRAQPQTLGFSGLLGHWPDAFGFLSLSASFRSVSASFRSLSSGSLPVRAACTQRGPLGTAAEKHRKDGDIHHSCRLCVAL